ncbi:MAG: DUF4956 domain-containing protein [Lachnospiraceae bacterium]
MLESLLSTVTSTLDIQSALICTAISLVLGLVIAVIYMSQGSYSKNYIVTLALLPAMVQVVIMLVNGNLGTSVAVMGAFSLVRFRSLPGTSKEIAGIFFSMVVGLATGMGYTTFAILITVIIGLAMFILFKSRFGEGSEELKSLKITIPETLDYNGVFDDLFDTFTKSHSLQMVKTTNMGSMFELQYQIILKDETREKEFLDEIRCRNGNLTIICGRKINNGVEL